MPTHKPILVLIDGHAVVFRAFYAFPPLTTSEGELVNAVYGFTRIVLKVIRDLHPEYIAVSFDMAKPTFRHTAFAGYKAQRKEVPSELLGQLGRVHEVVQALNIPIFEIGGYEADDIIGTIATKAAGKSLKTIIVTGDRDAYQLVKDGIVTVYMPPRGNDDAKEYAEEDVKEKMGIGPDQIIDYKALAGDASDNIPGVAGVGPKTATTLLQTFGSVDGVYKALAHPQKLTPKQKTVLKESLVKKLVDSHDNAFLSQKLATIDCNVPLTFNVKDCAVSGYDKKIAVELIQKLGFKSLVNMLPSDEFEQEVQGALF